MLIVACVNVGNYLGQGVKYVEILHDMVMRNLAEGTEGRFVVFTDNPDESYASGIVVREIPAREVKGWWAKLSLFKSGVFDDGDRILYLDLDTVITGPLDEIAAYDGPFAILRDVYRPNGLQSSVMLWEAGRYDYVWEGFEAFKFPHLAHGDQEWIERSVEYPVILQQQFPGKFVSFKRDARFGIPPESSICFFHGSPRPHEARGWVEHVWKIGGGTSAQLELVGNTDGDAVRSNIERCEADPDSQWLRPVDPHSHVAIICAGGPSIKDEIPSLQAHARTGGHIFACNNVPRLLHAYGINTDFHVVLDARPENAAFVSGIGQNTVCLYASQCDASVHDAGGDRVVSWHPAFEGILDIVGQNKERTYIGGGTTCGMKAATIAWTLGYREIHLYGFDSCYRDGEHHAYPQSLNDHEQIIDVEYNQFHYKCAPWMIQQAEDFEVFAPQLMDHGAKLFVHGTGLIPDIANQFSQGIFRPEAADFRAMAILERLSGIPEPQVAEVGVFAGDLSRRLLARREDLKLWMIDSWASAPKQEYRDSEDFHANLDADAQESYFHLTTNVTDFAKDRRTIFRADSQEAVQHIPDESLDMAFIDADHSYEGCKADIAAYYAKVKPGGFIAGHDYANDDWKFGPQVKRAVDEFVEANGLSLDLAENFCWFARKPNQGNPNVV